MTPEQLLYSLRTIGTIQVGLCFVFLVQCCLNAYLIYQNKRHVEHHYDLLARVEKLEKK